ncbi:Metallo-dependent phosphatase-like protein [Phascolomyces articulosus]|uniref:Metallo-dependent phosphatase-like protein n=1 Tax=Phascolomyces articulosus TaxID=60185 RepID=A0AAD5KBS3_9FUNG|nr:Metallo-dependent phosphatase-like protein [Phascolomyces articulosus]
MRLLSLVAIASSFLLSSTTITSGVIGHPLTKREQPNIPETPDLKLNPLEWGDVNFIHTTDTHGWLAGHLMEESYNGDLGDFYSFVVRMKEKAKKLKKDLFIIDTGDTHDGNGLSDVTNPPGKVSQSMLQKIPYDILAIGNHELYVDEITENVYKDFMPSWKGRYLASNVYFKDINNNKTIPLGDKYTYFTGEFGTRVLAFGFLFDFTGNGDNSVVHKVEDEILEPWFTEALTSHTPDIIALTGHTGIRFKEFNVALKAIRKHYPYIPIAVLGGHLHVRDFAIYDGWAAGIASGRYLESVGFFSIEGIKQSKKFIDKHGYNDKDSLPSNLTFHRRYLDQNRKTYIYHSVQDKEKKFDTSRGKKMTNEITFWRQKLGIAQALGCSPQDYYLSSVEPTSNASLFTLTTQEVLPKAVADPKRPYPAHIIINSGILRYDVYKGNFTLDNVYQVSPFVDHFYYMPGVPYDAAAQVLDRLNGDTKANSFRRKRSIRNDYEQQLEPLSYNIPMLRRAGDDDILLTPGYTTIDDLGSDGDDTTHSEIPYYNAKAFIATDMPQQGSNDADSLVDLVFVDFIQSIVESVIYGLTGKNYTVEKSYGNPNITSSTMWIDFAKNHWAENC